MGGGGNTFGYALQNPVNYYDPNGKEAAPAAAAFGSAFLADFLTPEPSDLLPHKWAAWAVAGVAIGGYAIYEACDEEDDECAKEIKECTELCKKAQHDPDMTQIWGGSWAQCMLGCVSWRCMDKLPDR